MSRVLSLPSITPFEFHERRLNVMLDHFRSEFKASVSLAAPVVDEAINEEWLQTGAAETFANALQISEPLRILFLGDAASSRQLAAEFLGHSTHGVDIEPPARDDAARHVYQNFYDFWGIGRTAHPILGLKTLPDFGGRFDIITASMICFSSSEKRPWSPKEWAFFLADLRDNHLKPGGVFLGTMSPGSMSEESWEYLKSHAREVTEKDFTFRIDDFSFLDDWEGGRRVRNSYSALFVGDIDGALNWYQRHSEGLVLERSQYGNMAIRANAAAKGELETGPILAAMMEEDNYRAFAVGQFVRERVLAGTSLKEAIAALPKNHAARYGEVLEQAYTEFPPDRALKPTKHIAIAGVSYCGSTLIERILGGMENSVSIGESVYLTYHHGSDGNVPIAVEDLDFRKTNKCSLCGLDCEYLTPMFRAALGFNPIDWYQQIGDRFGCDILVSSDKNLPKLLKHDPLLRFDALVIFKSPHQAWYSNMSKIKDQLSDEEMFERMKTYVELWREKYAELLYEMEPRGQSAFLDFDAFTHDPERLLTAALARLGVDLDPALLKRVVPSHSLGGNGNAVRQLREKDFEVNIRPRKDSLIPDAHREWIDAQRPVMRLYEALRNAASPQ